MAASDKNQRELEHVIDRVTESYRLGRPIDSLESTALPNRRKIIDAIAELEHVAYMGFYSTRVLSADNLRDHIAGHVHRAATGLVEQISRASATCAAAARPRRSTWPGPRTSWSTRSRRSRGCAINSHSTCRQPTTGPRGQEHRRGRVQLSAIRAITVFRSRMSCTRVVYRWCRAS